MNSKCATFQRTLLNIDAQLTYLTLLALTLLSVVLASSVVVRRNSAATTTAGGSGGGGGNTTNRLHEPKRKQVGNLKF